MYFDVRAGLIGSRRRAVRNRTRPLWQPGAFPGLDNEGALRISIPRRDLAFVFHSEGRLSRSDIFTRRNYAIRPHSLDPTGDRMPGALHRQ
jgi:hypothetical protein